MRGSKADQNPWSSVAEGLGIIAIIWITVFLISGTWPALFYMDKEGMVPNLNPGDGLIVVAKDRYGNLTTAEEGAQIGYGRLNNYPNDAGEVLYGDVIVFRPNGNTTCIPLVSRVFDYMNDNEAAASVGAIHGGYITKGDNQTATLDQNGVILDPQYISLGRIEPVKPEWIIGKVFFAVPFVGYIFYYGFWLTVAGAWIYILINFIISRRRREVEST